MRSLLLVALGLRRIAAQLRAIARELKRLGDLQELQLHPRGVGLRTLYRDDRPTAVEDATLFTQSDEDFATLEQLERDRTRQGGEVGLEEELEEIRESDG